MGNNASPQLFANLSRVITSWLPAIAKTMKQRYNRVSSYLDAIARASGAASWLRRRGCGWLVVAATAADYNGGVRGERQKADGRQTPCAYPHPDPTPLGPWLTKPLKDEAALLSLYAHHTQTRSQVHTYTPSRQRTGRKRDERSGAFEWASVERSVCAHTCMSDVCVCVCV